MRKSAEPIKSFQDVHNALKQYLPPARSQRGAYTLVRMTKLMDFLGNPQNSYQVIHVAGTSGKTSTCYYVASLLTQAGIKTGLTVSPHVDELNERTQINLKPLSESRFCKEFSVFVRQVKKSGIKPTYFELLTAFAFWEFQRQGCRYAVIEVGLGGLLDATNVVAGKGKLNIITDIGLDHEEVLGKSFELIAAQKAGIIKPYNTVVCYDQGEEIMQIIREAAEQQQAELHEIWPLKNSDLPHNLPLFQRRNWYLALAAYNVMAEHKPELPELNERQLAASTKILIPARMEEKIVGAQTVIMDGAHNQQKLAALTSSLKQRFPKQKLSVLASFVHTKQARLKDCLEELLPICDTLIITAFATENQEKVSVDPLKMVALCEELGFEKWQVIADPVKAYKTLLKKPGDKKLITGSFYLLNHIRPLL
jgi:dihydrofolate synthase/folylpolyglutamate synthase